MGLRDKRRKHEPQGILPFEYSPTGEIDEVTGRGGLPLVLETFRALELGKTIAEHIRIRKRDSGFSEAEHIEALVLLLAAGGECLDDLTILGADRGLLRLLDKAKLPSPDAARQFLLSFHDEALLADARARLSPAEKSLVAPESETLRGLGRVVAQLVERVDRCSPAQIATFEMDATIIESHKREAQPHYKGGRGYQPAIAYWVEQDLVVADQFRDGNVPAGKRPLDVIREGFAVVPDRIIRRRLRSDSAAYEEKTLKWCNDPCNHIERFTISADMSEPLRKLCEDVVADHWKLYQERANETVWWSEVELFPGDWEKMAKPLRTLVMKIEKRQGELFASGASEKYLAVVSNDFAEDGAKLLHWHYQKAGHIEVVHDIVKNELGGGVLPCGAFGANAAWFRLCLLTYDLLSAMKTAGLPPSLADARPKRLRFAVFNLAARVTSHARRTFARVAAVLSDTLSLLDFRRSLRRRFCTA